MLFSDAVPHATELNTQILEQTWRSKPLDFHPAADEAQEAFELFE